jgi:CARDB
MGRTRSLRLSILLLSMIGFMIALVLPSSISPVHAAGSLFVGPAQQGPFPIGSTFTYQVNVSNMDPFDSWDVVVQTDPSVLDPVSISVAGNMLGSVTVVADCINGSGSGCSINDNQGGAHSAAAGNTGIPVPGSGRLFTITYKVVKDGFSYLTIPTGLDTLANSGVPVSHSDIGAVYGNPPPVPVASFTFSPAPPANITQGVDNVTFDASGSTDPAGGTITTYSWEIRPVGGGILDIKNSTSQPTWVHQFKGFYEVGDLKVTLVVKDTLGLSSQPFGQVITVLEKPNPNLIVSTIRASPQDNILSGTPVSITATVYNKGNILEHGFNLTIFLDGRVFTTVNSTVAIGRGRTIDSTFTLNTTGLKPNTYDIVGTIQPSTDPNSSGFLTIRIVDPYLGASIPFTVPEFLGLVIATLAAIGVVRLLVNRSRLRRRLLEMELS